MAVRPAAKSAPFRFDCALRPVQSAGKCRIELHGGQALPHGAGHRWALPWLAQRWLDSPNVRRFSGCGMGRFVSRRLQNVNEFSPFVEDRGMVLGSLEQNLSSPIDWGSGQTRRVAMTRQSWREEERRTPEEETCLWGDRTDCPQVSCPERSCRSGGIMTPESRDGRMRRGRGRVPGGVWHAMEDRPGKCGDHAPQAEETTFHIIAATPAGQREHQ